MGRKSNYSESYKREAVAKAEASGNDLRCELMLAAQLHHTLLARQQLQHDLTLELWLYS